MKTENHNLNKLNPRFFLVKETMKNYFYVKRPLLFCWKLNFLVFFNLHANLQAVDKISALNRFMNN